jgi:quercetin dioxygenase-like cupin family protein
MNRLLPAVLVLALVAAASAPMSSVHGQTMQISPNGSRPSVRGPAQNFTGSVVVNPFFAANEHTPALGALVTFEPSARSAWHRHSGGQTLIVTQGVGWTQEEGGRKHEIKPGDVIWCPPGVKHWHGAAATTSMSHIAITNVVGGKSVEWMEKVSDEQYLN